MLILYQIWHFNYRTIKSKRKWKNIRFRL